MNKTILTILLQEYYSQRDIAKFFKVSQSTVKHYLKKFDLKTRKKKFKKNFKTVKKCIVCNMLLKNEAFYQKRIYSLSSYCKDCANKKSLKRQHKVGHERKAFFVEQKGGKCQTCGYNKCQAALHFHHRNPQEKEMKLDVRLLSNTSFDKLQNEINKCDLLCANCHTELHFPDKN